MEVISYIQMSHICNECDEDDCEAACKNDRCALMQRKT